MPTNIYEETNVTAEAVLEVGFTGGEVEFTFLKGAESLPESKKMNVDKDQAGKGVSQVCKAPLVPDDLETYLLKASIDADKKRLFNEECTVWPRKATLAAVDDKDKALPDFRFRVVQNGHEGDSWFNTESDGTSKPFDLLMAPFTVRPEPPFEIIATVVGVGRKRKVKARKIPYTLELVEPQTGGRVAANLTTNDVAAGMRQYTNLASTDGRDGNGSKVVFKVRIKESDQHGKPDQKAYVWVQHKKDPKLPGKIRRDSPEPGLESTTPGFAVESTDADGLRTQTATLPIGSTGEAEFTVEMGKTGGDWCEVKVGSTAACGDAKLIFQNWRQLDYEIRAADEMLSYMTVPGPNGLAFDLPGSTRSKLTEIFDSIYTELLLKKAHKAAAASTPSYKAGEGFLLPKSFLKPGDTSGDQLHCLTRNWGSQIVTKWDAFTRVRPDTTICMWFCHILLFGPTTSTTLPAKVTEADTVTFAVPGNKTWLPIDAAIESIEWEAVTRPQDLLSGAATLAFDESGLVAGADGASERKFTLSAGGASKDVLFSQPKLSHISTTVTQTAKNDIRDLLTAAATQDKLRAGNKTVTLALVGENGNSRRRTRVANLKQAAQDAFDALAPTLDAHPAATGGAARKGTLTAAAVDFAASDVSKIVVKLPKVGTHDPGKWVGAAGDAKAPVKVTVKLASLGLGGPCAYTAKPWIWMVPYHPFNHAMVAIDLLTMLLAHEVGHKMKMSLHGRSGSNVAPGLPNAEPITVPETRYPHGGANGHMYAQKGHNGPHCAYGLNDGEKAAPSYVVSGITPKCLMFGGEVPGTIPLELCPQCIDYLAAHDLSNIVGT
jgi:hypothetical protein